mgnify:CR=1 FL=1
MLILLGDIPCKNERLMNLDELYTYMIVNISDRYEQDSTQLEIFMDMIAYHESRRDPLAKQIGGGPGRGLYQFEKGAKEGGETAMNRLLRWFSKNQIDAPQWTHISTADGVDATNVPKLGQDMMFLGNVRYHPKASFKGLTAENLPLWWAKYHWAGPEHQAEARIKSFNSSMRYYPGIAV